MYETFKKLAIAVALLSLISTGHFRANGQVNETKAIFGEKPLSEIPKHITFKRGTLSLFADFEAIRDDGIVLYLINDTDKSVSIPPQDGDDYAKQEVLMTAEGWRRVQPHFVSSCGNSYFRRPALRSGHFRTFRGNYSTEGKATTIRYRIGATLNLVSNTGKGMINVANLKLARFDDVASKSWNVDEVTHVLFGNPDIPARYLHSRRVQAIRRLGDLPAVDSVPVLTRLTKDPDAVEIREEDSLKWRWLLTSYQKSSQTNFDRFVVDTIKEGPAARRAYVIEFVSNNPCGSPAIAKALIDAASNHDDPNIVGVIDALAYTRESAAVPVLRKIMDNPQYDDEARWQARYEISSRYGSKVFDIKMRVVQPLASEVRERRDRPVLVAVTLRNITDHTISFSYRRPTEFLAPIIAEYSIHHPTPLPKHCNFSEPIPKINAVPVVIKPAQAWTVQVNLSELFSFPEIPFRHPSCGVFCHISGVHKIPQMSSNGIRLKAPRSRSDPFSMPQN